MYFGSQVGGVKPQSTDCFALRRFSGKAGISGLKAEKATRLIVTRRQTEEGTGERQGLLFKPQ